MIILTGASGFIGSVVLSKLNKEGVKNITLVDDLGKGSKFKNLNGKEFTDLICPQELPDTSEEPIEAIVHIGANSNTLNSDWMDDYYLPNISDTRKWFDMAESNGVPFIFLSSAAVKGNGEGPISQYGFSKFAAETITKNRSSTFDPVILRPFNVYGPNEYHKQEMASIIYRWYNEFKNEEKITLFEGSDNFSRDFVFVEDMADAVLHFIKNPKIGTYEIGTGHSTTYEELSNIFLSKMGVEPTRSRKEYVPMPDHIKKQYQKFTSADTTSLELSEFPVSKMIKPEQGIEIYLEYLRTGSYI